MRGELQMNFNPQARDIHAPVAVQRPVRSFAGAAARG
jgi:hypothetical protein